VLAAPQAYGLLAMPIGMIRGRKKLGAESIEVQEDLADTRAQYAAVQSRVRAPTGTGTDREREARMQSYNHTSTGTQTGAGETQAYTQTHQDIDPCGCVRADCMYVCQSMGGRTTKKQDQKSLDELERKERLLSRKSAAIERDTTSRWARIRACLRPFEVRDRVRERERGRKRVRLGVRASLCV
jgi:hypothetical protein